MMPEMLPETRHFQAGVVAEAAEEGLFRDSSLQGGAIERRGHVMFEIRVNFLLDVGRVLRREESSETFTED